MIQTLISLWIYLIAFSLHADALERAKQYFKQQNCRKAVSVLSATKTPNIEDEAALIETYQILGICYFQLGEKDKAETELTHLLFIKPDYELNAFVTQPELISLFQQLKTSLHQKSQELAQTREQAAECKNTEKKIVYVKHSIFPAFVPFGIGQFENGDNTKGIILASTQASMLATNIGAYWWKRSLTSNTTPSFSSIQILQWVSFGAFLGIYVYGVVDALLNRQEWILEPNSDEFFQQLEQAKIEAK